MKNKKKIFENLYKDYHQRIYRICYSFINDKSDVDDLVQEVYFRIWKNLGKFRGESNIYTWVYRVTINTAINYRWKLSKRKMNTLPDNMDLVVREHGEDNENSEKLWNCISRLDTIERSLVSLSLEGLSYREIGIITGIVENTIAVRIHRIKSKLKNCINKS